MPALATKGMLLCQRVHRFPPAGTINIHDKESGTACKPNQAHYSKEPAVANRVNHRNSDKRPDTRKDVSHEVVECHAGRRFLWHELSQHRSRHAEYKHRPHTENEISNHLHYQKITVL